MGLGYEVGMIWSDLGSGKTQGKPRFSGLAKERRSAVLARRGARLISGQGEAPDLLGAAAQGQFQDRNFCNLGLCSGGSGNVFGASF